MWRWQFHFCHKFLRGLAKSQEPLFDCALSSAELADDIQWDYGQRHRRDKPAEDVGPQRVNVGVTELQRAVPNYGEDKGSKYDARGDVFPAVFHHYIWRISDHVCDITIETVRTIDPTNADGLEEGQ